MKLDVATVLNATGARALSVAPGGAAAPAEFGVADLEKEFSAVSIDSRLMEPDALFVALPGERADGNDFVDRALLGGARGCLVSRLPPEGSLAALPDLTGSSRRYLFKVPDTAAALQALARYWRSRHQAKVVGVTGSIGKTTTKEILAQILAPFGPILKSEANLNTEIGLPLTLLRLRPHHRAAVLEMGMYERGDIALLARVAQPRVGIVTAVAPIHLERMGTIERIAREKSELVAALPPDGLAVLNGDDEWTRAMGLVSGVAPVALVGLAPDCRYRAVDVVGHGLRGVSFTVLADGVRLPLRTQVPGAHTVHAFLAAVAVARFLGIGWDEIAASAQAARLESRQRALPGRNGIMILDDSYNAAPPSMRAALELLRACPGIRVAVLGDMLELGPGEEGAHREVGAWAAEIADWLIVRGPRARWTADEARKRGLPAGRVMEAETNADAVRAVLDLTARAAVPAGAHPAGAGTGPDAADEVAWTVLVKGSRGMRMEEIVEGLRGEGCTAGI